VIKRPEAEFFSRHDPELRNHRVRLTRTVIYTFFLVLAVAILADLAFSYLPSDKRQSGIEYDLLAIALLAALGFLAFLLLQRGHVDRAGYVLGSAIFIATFAGCLLLPQYVHLISVGYLLSILVIGTIVGGRAGFSFAALSFVAMIISWWRARYLLGEEEGPFSNTFGFVLISSFAVLEFGLAAVLHTLSQYILQTIARLHSQTEQLTHLAHTDPLTELANRRHLIEQLEREFTRAVRYKRPLTLIYLDMDGFKSINDRFGHLFGDEILRGAALAMRAVLRSADVLARIGGDEFAILLPETTISGAQGVISKLRKALSAYAIHLGPMVPPLSFCAGIGQIRRGDKSIDDLLARSDEAQYRAKEAGNGQTRTQHELDQLPLFDHSQTQDES
jgi:diguanylate cyclase (GGDEF)-like protein